MKKYFAIFKISWGKELSYRFNFMLARLRNIIILLLLYFVWLNLSAASGKFAGYSADELMTYVIIVNIMRSLIFGSQSRELAAEINEGIFSKYLSQPLNHFWYGFWRELAPRIINFISALIECLIFYLIFRPRLLAPDSIVAMGLFTLSIILAIFLYFLLSYLISLLAFWSREAMGPRFLFEWLLEFSSGAYFPLSILSGMLLTGLSILPFYYLVYFPAMIFLERLSAAEIIIGFAWQSIWLILIGLAVRLIYGKGLKHYSGEGI